MGLNYEEEGRDRSGGPQCTDEKIVYKFGYQGTICFYDPHKKSIHVLLPGLIKVYRGSLLYGAWSGDGSGGSKLS